MEGLPVAPNIQVLDYRTYVHNANRRVALAAVRSEYGGPSVKFYKWKWNGERWKVDLARFLVIDVDLCRLASDAIELARKHGITLKWPSLREIADVDVSIQERPSCPKCKRNDTVRQYGTVSIWQCSGCGECWRT